MKYLFWIPVGIVCGAALGFLVPIALGFLVVLKAGNNANGIGTPLAIMMIVTVPAGAVFGAAAGAHRARTGRWRGFASTSTSQIAPQLRGSTELRREFADLEIEIASMPEEQAPSAREDYLRGLVDEYDSARFNYRWFAAWIFIGLAIPILLFFPVGMLLRFHLNKNALREHTQEVMRTWS